MSANERQVGGNHYKQDGGEEHWDRQWRMNGRGYFVGCITKYVERYHNKNGIQDLEKAHHFLEKLIELERAALPTDMKVKQAMFSVVSDGRVSLTEEGASVIERAMRRKSQDFMVNHPTDVTYKEPLPENWTCEGWYGDLTQLYKHRCGRCIRATSIVKATEVHAKEDCTAT